MALFSSPKPTTKARSSSSLTAVEAADLATFEAAIEAGLPHVKAMIEAGKALAAIRDRQLYRDAAPTFPVYLRDRWELTPRRAAQLIQFSGITAVVEEIVGEAAPTLTERAVRPLAGLADDDLRDAVVEAAADGMTPAAIEKAATRRKKKGRRPPRPVRLRLPGGTVVIEINRKGMAAGVTVEVLLAAAIEAVGREAAGKAA